MQFVHLMTVIDMTSNLNHSLKYSHVDVFLSIGVDQGAGI